MNIIEIAEELRTYLHTHEGNRRTIDAIDEIILQLKQDLSNKQRQQEIKRLGDMISFLLEKEDIENTNQSKDALPKQQFSANLKQKLEICREECLSMTERKTLELSPLIQGFEEDFRTQMNVRLNGAQMEDRENLSRLVRGSLTDLNRNLRTVVKEFTHSAMNEMEFCMERVRKAFAETEIADCHTSYQEINNTVMCNYDTMQKNIHAIADNYEYPSEKFDSFAETAGIEMEKVSNRHRGLLTFFKFLPALLYLIKYVVDNYILPKENWFDILMNKLMEWIELSSQKDSSLLLGILEIVIQFIQDNKGAFELSAQFLILFFFIGWLYYIYIKIISKMWKRHLYHKQQAVIQPLTEQFLKELDIRGEIRNILVTLESRIAENYMQKHRVLFEKLITSTSQNVTENKLQSLQTAYLEYIGNGGL